MFVVGDKEVKKQGVNVRIRGEQTLGLMTLQKVIKQIRADIDNKRQV